MSLYPSFDADKAVVSQKLEQTSAQTFRLHKIGDLESFLWSEVESRGRLHKKYHKAVNALDGTCAALGAICIVSGTVGAGLLTSGIGFVPGLALEAIAAVASLFDITGLAVSRLCSTKAAKHKAVCILATSKLNTVYSHIFNALCVRALTVSRAQSAAISPAALLGVNHFLGSYQPIIL